MQAHREATLRRRMLATVLHNLITAPTARRRVPRQLRHESAHVAPNMPMRFRHNRHELVGMIRV
jgi:hypothetical protein